jgi:membrane-associated phospholipid phosphatase
MNKLKSILADNRNFFIVYIFFFGVGLIFLLSAGKAASFVYLNPYHRTPLDIFFINFTYLGDGLFVLAVFLLLMYLKRYAQGFQLLTAFLLSALLAQILKSIFSMPRPKQFFNPGVYDYFISGVTHTGFSSFPSGHSTSVFTLATLLALFEKNKKWNVAYLVGAVAVGYSRIYLGQHFLNDVLFGSFIGVFASVLVHWLWGSGLTRRARLRTH